MAKKKTLAEAAGGSTEPEVEVPVTTRNFINNDTYDTMTIVHDPKAGTYTETVTSKATGKKTVTVHKGISHSWARWQEVIAPSE